MVLCLRLTVIVAVLLVTCDGFLQTIPIYRQRLSRSCILQASKDPSIVDDILNTPAKVQKSLNDAQKNIQSTANDILQTPDRIVKSVNDLTKQVGDTVDAVVEFPSNVAAKVVATKTKIEKAATDVQRLASIPITLFQKAWSIIEDKGFKGRPVDDDADLVPTKLPRSEKSSMEIFEEVKESAYATYDTLVAVTEGVKATAETLKKLPSDINDVQTKATVTAENIQKDLGKAQQQAEVAGKVFVKIVTGEAAQETIESALDTYTKTKIATEKTIESVQAFVKDPISIVKGPPPPPPPPPKKTEAEIKMTETVNTMKGSLETVKESFETVKAVSAATMSTANSLSKGAMGLKDRFDKNLQAQGLAKSANKASTDPTRAKAVAPPPTPVVPTLAASNYFTGKYQYQHEQPTLSI